MNNTTFGSHLYKASAGIILLRVISYGLAFVISLILARLLGTAGYGIYAYSFAWVGFLFVFAILGFDKLLVRDISVYKIKSDWALMRGLIGFSYRIVLFFSLILVTIAVFVSITFLHSSEPIFMYTFCLAMILLPFLVLITLKQSVLVGLQRVVLGHVPEMFIRPLLLFVCLLFIYFFGFGLKKIFSPITAMFITIFAAIISFWLISFFLKKELPEQIQRLAPVYNKKLWIQSSLPLMLIGGMLVINSHTDIIMLGAIKGTKVAGIYNVANSYAGLISFFLVSVNSVLSPTIASMYAEGNMLKLQHKVTISARFIIFLSLPIVIILFFFGKVCLTIFGSEFIYGLNSLKILCIGQIINVSAGSVGVLLNMTGHERVTAMGFGIGAISNLILNAALIPILGMIGAAIASSISMALWNLILAIKVYKLIGIHSTVFGNLTLKN